MTPTKEHHAHPASSDTQGAITSRSGVFFPMCFISKGRWWAGPCTCCQTKSPQITPGIATECPHLTRTLPSWNKRHAEGRSDGDGKEEPLAMLKQTPLEWGLDYYTRQGDFFSLLPLLLMLANSWWPQAWRPLDRGPAETRGKGTGGWLCKGEHLKRHILWVLLFESYAWLANPVTLRLQAADILTKTKAEYCLHIQMISGKSC